jgi:hypothetical protein
MLVGYSIDNVWNCFQKKFETYKYFLFDFLSIEGALVLMCQKNFPILFEFCCAKVR